ncbi:MAG TPA: hypothetical protein VIV06_12200, partial [Candidatus Limnocylindrales bacterium]
MAEERAEGVPSVEPRCPWCSSLLPAADAAECPSCGAALLSDGDPQLPGLTTVTPPALIKSN